MPGTAEGAAKATRARREQAAERRLLREQLSAAIGPGPAQLAKLVPVQPLASVERCDVEQPSTPERSEAEIVAASLTVAPAVAPAPAPVPSPAQHVAPLVPAAMRTAGDVITGKIKASPAVRANAALRVLEMSQRQAPVHREQPGLLDALAALSRALGARMPRTVEGEVVGAEPVKSE